MRPESGFSLIELLVVAAIIIILSVYAVIALMPHKNAYKTDDQALQILDFMRDAGQRALTNRRTMRLEIDLTANVIRIIDKTPDTVVRQMPLESTANVKIATTPASTNKAPGTVPAPPAPSNYAAAVYTTSTDSVSLNNSVCVLQFGSDGTVKDQSNTITSTTLYLWQPQSSTVTDTPANVQGVRAITVFGGTGAVKFWKYNGTAFVGA